MRRLTAPRLKTGRRPARHYCGIENAIGLFIGNPLDEVKAPVDMQARRRHKLPPGPIRKRRKVLDERSALQRRRAFKEAEFRPPRRSPSPNLAGGLCCIAATHPHKLSGAGTQRCQE